MIRMIPDFFIVGAPKCGTTALYTYLRAHPEIFMPDNKEPEYFCPDLYGAFSIRSKEQYLSLFLKSTEKKRKGEATPIYLYSMVAFKKIKDFNPKADIIIMLRNPIDAMYSQYYQMCYSGDEDIKSFEEAINAEKMRKAGLHVPRTLRRSIKLLYYKEIYKYTSQIKRYFDLFGREKVHIIIYDDFKEDTSSEYRRTLSFLGVDDTIKLDFKVINPNKILRFPTLKRIMLDPIIRKIGRNLVPLQIRQAIKEYIKKTNTRYTSRPPMNPETRQRLKREFAREIEELSKLLGRDLTHWLK